mgnify:CR=1 FL=1
MVQITIQADNGITHKVWEKEGNAFNDDPGVLRYYFYGPGGNPSKRNELGCFDLKGRYAGKFKANDGAKTNLNVVNDEKEAVITLIAPSGDKVYIGKVRGPMTTQDRITLGMCINNATSLVCASDASTSEDGDTVQAVYDLADKLYEEYRSRYITE